MKGEEEYQKLFDDIQAKAEKLENELIQGCIAITSSPDGTPDNFQSIAMIYIQACFDRSMMGDDLVRDPPIVFIAQTLEQALKKNKYLSKQDKHVHQAIKTVYDDLGDDIPW